REQNVIPIPNPAFHYEFGDGYMNNYGERSKQMYPLRDFLEAGIPAAIASDCPVIDFSPMRGIHAAIKRKSDSGKIIGEQQTISLIEAIRMYTINGAYASFEENIKGSVEPGKLADIIVLDRSILKSDTDELLKAQVEVTMLDGDIVYTNNQEEFNYV